MNYRAMNHRERVLAALRHEEPDRVPLDFGGTGDSTIAAFDYAALRRHLGLEASVTRVGDVLQYVAVIEEDVRQVLDADTVPVTLEPRAWRRGSLPDGSAAEFPARFEPQVFQDGSQVVLDAAGNAVLKMQADGFYFDPIYSPLADATHISDIDQHMDAIEHYDTPIHLDKSLEQLAKQARDLRDKTDHALVAYFGGHILQAGQSLRGWETFLVDLLLNKRFAHALMDKLTEANLGRLERFADTVGKHVDVIHFEDDLGMQDRPLLSPALYREMVKPYHQRLFSFAKSCCDGYLLLHTDGAVAPFIPDFIEMGIDAINPVQVSAAGMDTRALKREFGRDITFWGAGCDSQTTLPFGTPAQVADEVKRRIDDLAPGGGFVFSSIHNVQAGVPVENTVTMFRTAREYGVYR